MYIQVPGYILYKWREYIYNRCRHVTEYVVNAKYQAIYSPIELIKFTIQVENISERFCGRKN